VLHELMKRIEVQSGQPKDTSYTAQLLAHGTARIAKKIGEEGVEVALAVQQGDKTNIVNETADLLYHLLVGLYAHGIPLMDVEEVLEYRRTQSGLAEKAART
jgi:phosphoribosyl-ATP pyrophosphohydrolase